MAVLLVRCPAALPSDEVAIVTDWLGWSVREEAFRLWNDDKWRHELADELTDCIVDGFEHDNVVGLNAFWSDHRP